MTKAMLFGWTCEQWSEAQHYYNLCHEDKIKLESIYSVCLRCVPGYPGQVPNLDDWMKVMDWWKSRRLDEPGDVSILTLEAT